ncbi:MAG: hypothetical protein ACQET1_00955 [Gemmatimonadota bacterium]
MANQKERSAAPVDLDQKVDFLSHPGNHPHGPAEVETIETHMAWVFLAGTEVIKLKKPVRYDYLDFATLDARWEDCLREVRLNRRLTSGVYRGIRALRRSPDGDLALSGALIDPPAAAGYEEEEGAGGGAPPYGERSAPGDAEADREVAEWLVQMRRLPRNRMLDVLIETGTVPLEEVRGVVEKLVPFYRKATPVRLTPPEYRDRFQREIRECRREIEKSEVETSGGSLERVEGGLLAFLAERSEALDARALKSRIVEGHGDLRPEHICLTSEPAVIDCLEFNFDLRVVDPVDDLAFLTVECVRLGDPGLGDLVLSWYRSASGDDPPEELIAFYRGYRALLRAKISAWHLLDEGIEDQREKWIGRTGKYLELAGEFLSGV